MIAGGQVQWRAGHGEIKWLWDLIAIVIAVFVRIVETLGFLEPWIGQKEMKSFKDTLENAHREKEGLHDNLEGVLPFL